MNASHLSWWLLRLDDPRTSLEKFNIVFASYAKHKAACFSQFDNFMSWYIQWLARDLLLLSLLDQLVSFEHSELVTWVAHCHNNFRQLHFADGHPVPSSIVPSASARLLRSTSISTMPSAWFSESPEKHFSKKPGFLCKFA